MASYLVSLASANVTFADDPVSPFFTLQFTLKSETDDDRDSTFSMVSRGTVVEQAIRYFRDNRPIVIEIPDYWLTSFTVYWQEEVVRKAIEHIAATPGLPQKTCTT